jgi:hypothetical protein
MHRWILASLVGLVFAVTACAPKDYVGDYCSALNSCAKKAGAQFSISSCKDSVNAGVEQAGTVGCDSQAEDYLDCVDGTDCDAQIAWANNQTVPTDCGATYNKYAKCLQ